MRSGSGVALFVACLLVFVGSLAGGIAAAQEAEGRIVGNVTDQTGAAVVGARVTVTNVGTQISRSTATDKNGFYEVLSLPIGSYKVTIEMSGFRKQAFEHQALQINQSLRLDANLEVGQQNEVVEVTGQAANVETVNQTVGTSIVGETIQRAPLNGRNVLDLAKLLPGVTETNDDSGAAGNYSIAGGRSTPSRSFSTAHSTTTCSTTASSTTPIPTPSPSFAFWRATTRLNTAATEAASSAWSPSPAPMRGTAAPSNSCATTPSTPTPSSTMLTACPEMCSSAISTARTFGGPIMKGQDRFFFVGYQGQRLSEQQPPGRARCTRPRN